MNLGAGILNFADILQQNKKVIKKTLFSNIQEPSNSPSKQEVHNCLCEFNTFEATYLSSYLLNLAGQWGIQEVNIPNNSSQQKASFRFRMGTISIAEGILRYGYHSVSKGSGNRATMSKVKKLIKVIFAAAYHWGEIGVRSDQEWVQSIVSNLDHKKILLSELGTRVEGDINKDYRDWATRVLNRNPFFDMLNSFAAQHSKETGTMVMIWPLGEVPDLQLPDGSLWPGALEVFGTELPSLKNKLLLVYKNLVFFSPAYFMNKATTMIINSVESQGIITKNLGLNLTSEDCKFLSNIKNKMSKDFEKALAQRIFELISLYTPCFVHVNVENISWNGKVIFDQNTGGEIDCLVYLPAYNKLLVLEIKNKALPTNYDMVEAQHNQFLKDSNFSDKLEKKIMGIKELINLTSGEFPNDVFPGLHEPIYIDSENVLGAFVTSFVSSEQNNKYPVISVSEIPKLLSMLN